jgi:hypothetical protein
VKLNLDKAFRRFARHNERIKKQETKGREKHTKKKGMPILLVRFVFVAVTIKTKKLHVLEYIKEGLLNNPLVYPVFEKLLTEVDYSDIGDLDEGYAKSMLLYICGQLIRKNTDQIYSNQPLTAIPISSNKLQKVFGNGYSKYMAYFIGKEIVQRSGVYIPGRVSYEYNINSSYHEHIVFRTMSNKRTESRIRSYNINQFNSHRKLYNDSYNAIYWFTTGKLEINKDAAINCIEKFKDRSNLRLIAGNVPDDRILKLINIKFPSQFNTSERHIESITKRDYEVFIHYRGWRLYSVLTQMSSLLRNYLSYDGNELCAIDIKNSQAFHLCHLFNPDFWASQNRANSFATLYTKDELEDSTVLYNYIHGNKTLLKKIRTIARAQSHDILEFKRLAYSGTLYEDLSLRLKAKYPSLHRDREASKKRWVMFLNFDISKANTNAYADYRAFKEMFPNVCKMIELLKHRNYTDIAFLLQRLEAKMLTHNFTSEFADGFPQIPIFTVHDTFITYAGFKDQAIELLDLCYRRSMNAAVPTDGGKNLNHTNAMQTLDDYMDSKLQDSGLSLDNIDLEYYQELFEKYVT